MEKQATRDAYGKALLELGRLHDDIVVLDADLSKSTKTV
ncbi:MAG: transketolase family protein, partial [Syntrophomonas sp.]